MMRPWLVVDCYVEDPEGGAGNFLPHLTDREALTARPAWGVLPDRPTRFGGLVITGSAAGVNDGLAWVDGLVEFVRHALADRVPVLGVCFGHQVLAQALLGPGAIRTSPHPEVGWFPITHSSTSPLLADFPKTFTTFLSHHDEVDPSRAGPLTVFAHSERCAIQGYRVPDRRAWGMQFHAEMSRIEASGLVRRRIGDAVQAEAMLSQAVDSAPLIASLTSRFVEAAR
ncbi:MAG: GMP synthase-like glutamine amidotransferase [Myxococcota bacterium]|jgi:GMP synthase-like glutamine amidotransferase